MFLLVSSSQNDTMIQWPSGWALTLHRLAAFCRRRCCEEWLAEPVGAAAGRAVCQVFLGLERHERGAAQRESAPDAKWYFFWKGFYTHMGCLHCLVCIPPWGYDKVLNNPCGTNKNAGQFHWREQKNKSCILQSEVCVYFPSKCLKGFIQHRTALQVLQNYHGNQVGNISKQRICSHMLKGFWTLSLLYKRRKY